MRRADLVDKAGTRRSYVWIKVAVIVVLATNLRGQITFTDFDSDTGSSSAMSVGTGGTLTVSGDMTLASGGALTAEAGSVVDLYNATVALPSGLTLTNAKLSGADVQLLNNSTLTLLNGSTLTAAAGSTINLSAANIAFPTTVVLTTGSQTLTGKTLVSPTISSLTSASSSDLTLNASGGASVIVGAGTGFTAGITLATKGAAAIVFSSKDDPINRAFQLGMGWWHEGTAFVRPIKAPSQGILDVLANGPGQDSWIDIGSDFTVDAANGEFLELRKTANGYGSIKAKGIGTGSTRPLVLQLGADNVLIGGTNPIPGDGGLKIFGTTAATSAMSGALQVAGGAGIAGALYVGSTINSTNDLPLSPGDVGKFVIANGNLRVVGNTIFSGVDSAGPLAGNGLKITPISNVDSSGRSMVQLDTYNATGASGPFILTRRARGTLSAPAATQSGDILFSISNWGYGSSGFSSSPRIRVDSIAAETWTNSAQGAYLTFSTTPTGGTATAEVARLTSRGNLLIGTTTDIAGTGAIVASKFASSSGALSLSSGSGGNVSLQVNGSEKAQIDSGGNFLVGTTVDSTGTTGAVVASGGIYTGIDSSPPIVGSGFKGSSNARSIFQLDTYSSVATDGSLLFGRHARGTFAAPSQTKAGDTLFSIGVRGYNNAGSFSGTMGRIEFFAAEDVTSSATGSYITFSTTPTGTAGNGTEVARLTAGGNLLVGTTTDISGTHGLSLAGTTASTSTTTGALVVSGGAGIQKQLFLGDELRLIPTSSTAATVRLSGTAVANTPGIWFRDGGSPTAANVALSGSSASTTVNGPANGALNLRIGGTTYAQVNPTAFLVQTVPLTVSTNTASTSTTTGGATFAGGIGVVGRVSTGSLNVGTGTTVTGILSTTAALTFPTVAAGGGVQDLTVTLNGVAVGDDAHVVEADGTFAPAGLIVRAVVTAANTVKVRATNVSAAAITPTAKSYRVTVLKF